MSIRKQEPRALAAHLAGNRSLILGRAAVAGAMSMVPVPLLDEVLSNAVRRALLARIAAVRQVDVDERGLRLLADVERDGGLARVALGHGLRRAFVRMAVVARVASRTGEFATTFALATLFDHYCARHHVGFGLDEQRARELRQTIDAAISAAPFRLARRGLGRAAKNAGSAVRQTSRALLRPLRPSSSPAVPERVAPDEPSRPAPANLAQRMGYLLDDTGHGWIEELLRAFDERWAARRTAPSSK